ncbi:amidohydrolase family protein [Sphingobium tyrosinilyticum]|uniref:Amidohydrolase family protein n=1 Tax=Sphingobium tyrosinilyticum TaxID=2715436 RepID=A0ABV9F180_9SPHN
MMIERPSRHSGVLVSGRPVTYLLMQSRSDPEDWRRMIGWSAEAQAAGLGIYPQVSSRGIGALTSLQGYHFFLMRRAYHEVSTLPLSERAAALRDPQRRAAVLSQPDDPGVMALDPKLADFIALLRQNMANVYPMTEETLDYEPGPERKAGGLAQAAGISLEELIYDHYSAADGRKICASFMLNYAEGNLDATYEMLRQPFVAAALGDGGAHVRMVCDASWPTFQLAFWARNRKRGPILPLPHVVKKLTGGNAALYGLSDRGVIAPGLRADINVIDHDRLRLHLPEMLFDLPSGGGRIHQSSSGYLATMVNGVLPVVMT